MCSEHNFTENSMLLEQYFVGIVYHGKYFFGHL